MGALGGVEFVTSVEEMRRGEREMVCRTRKEPLGDMGILKDICRLEINLEEKA